MARATDCESLLEYVKASWRAALVPEEPTESGASGPVSTGGGGFGIPGPSISPWLLTPPGADEPDPIESDGQHLFVAHRGNLDILALSPELSALDPVELEGLVFGSLAIEEASSAPQRLLVLSEVEAVALVERSGIELAQDNVYLKLTLLAPAEGVWTTSAEYYFEGRYHSLRRTGQRVRPLLNLARSLPEDVEALKIEDVLPQAFMVQGDELTPLPVDCSSVYTPEALSLNPGGAMYVPELDLDLLGPATGSVVWGTAGIVQRNERRLVLASGNDYPHAPARRGQTQLHVFDTDSEDPLTYRASGLVWGLMADPWALALVDEQVQLVTSHHEGELRTVQLSNLESEGTELRVVGQSEPFEALGYLQGVHRAGSTVYVDVSGAREDAILAVDSSNPSAPRLLGRVELPGFSRFAAVVGEDRVLTLGSGEPGEMNAVMRLFDTTDPTQPQLIATREMTSDALPPDAITYETSTFLSESALLATPVSAWYYDSQVVGFDHRMALVTLDGDSSLSALAWLDAGQLEQQVLGASACEGNVSSAISFQHVRVIGDDLFAVAPNAVVRSSLTAPDVALSSVVFPMFCPAP